MFTQEVRILAGVRKQGHRTCCTPSNRARLLWVGEADWTMSESMLQAVDVIGTLNSNLTGVDPEAVITASSGQRGQVGED